MKVRTGCISWTYSDWLGSFYPEGTKSSDFLSMYARAFDIVEIDSSFYRIPNPATVKQWKEKTPDDFLFTAKFPKKMTHEAKLKGIESSLSYFEKVISGLGSRLACIIVQMPPSFKFEKGIDDLRVFLNLINPKLRYAIEFRHESWMRGETFELLKSKNACFVWSINEYVDEIPDEVTSNFLYLRFMGEYSEFTKFDHLQKDKSEILEAWWKKLESKKLETVESAYVLVSNHFAGFAPDTVNQFRQAAGMGQINLKESMSKTQANTLLKY